MDKYQNSNKKDARILTLVTFSILILWLCVFYFSMTSKAFSDARTSPSVLLILGVLIFMLTSLIVPFIAFYYWSLENFSLKSKFVTSVIFSISPWILYVFINWIFDFLGKK